VSPLCYYHSISQCLTELGQLSCLIDYAAETVVKIVPCISVYRPGGDEACLPSINDFVLYLTIQSGITVPELMMSLIYLSWFRNRLPPGLKGRPSTPHRVSLAASMLAQEVHNDDCMENARWAELHAIPECELAGFYNVEVNLMERQFLAWLVWDGHINADQDDLLNEKVWTAPACPSPFRLFSAKDSEIELAGVASASIDGQAQHGDYGTASPA
jgi:hypothetical protein